MAQDRQLVGVNGNFICTLSKDEVANMEEHGKIKRVSRKRYRLVESIAASKSQESAPMLTRSDMEALIGACKMTQERRERLAGWGLISAPQMA